MLHCCLIHNSY